MDTKAIYSAADEQEPFEINPKPVLVVALATTGLAFVLTWLFPVLVDWASIVRWLLVVPGLLATAVAVRVRPSLPGIWALAAVALFLSSLTIAVPVTHHGDDAKMKPVKTEDGPLTARGHKVTINEDETDTPVVLATFEDSAVTGPPPSAAPGGPRDARGAFTSTIRWNDGYTSSGIIEPGNGGAYVVKSAHPLEDEGYYPGQVTIVDNHKRDVTVNFRVGVRTCTTGRLVLQVLAVLALGASIVLLLARTAKPAEATPQRRAR